MWNRASFCLTISLKCRAFQRSTFFRPVLTHGWFLFFSIKWGRTKVSKFPYDINPKGSKLFQLNCLTNVMNIKNSFSLKKLLLTKSNYPIIFMTLNTDSCPHVALDLWCGNRKRAFCCHCQKYSTTVNAFWQKIGYAQLINLDGSVTKKST